MKIKIKHFVFWSDWTEVKEKAIETDNFSYLELERRGTSWYLTGHLFNREKKEWEYENLSQCGLTNLDEYLGELKPFISKISTNNSLPFDILECLMNTPAIKKILS
jgi:hypothetical protein